MNVGWVGLGKLGLPIALVLAQHHSVYGYDVSTRPWDILAGKTPPMREEDLDKLLADRAHHPRRVGSIRELVLRSDVIFVAVQTPHAAAFGGEAPVPDERRDFEYAYLVQACRDVCRAAEAEGRDITLVVVSTVLPGTTGRLIMPLLNSRVKLVYSPQFIAMGTTIEDFTNPEFVICGTSGDGGERALREVLAPLRDETRLFPCSIIDAESVKVLYNTFLSLKIVWANHVMELCHKTGADCDVVVDALQGARDRVISGRYLRGGMGDGGACHPRDLIALSWLEQQQDASVPLFGTLVQAREAQTRWLADVVRGYAELTGSQVIILGESYKPGSDLTDGSPALLLKHYLDEVMFRRPLVYDPHTGTGVAGLAIEPREPRVYVVAARHKEFPAYPFAPGSVVVDPFGYIPDKPGVTVVRVGRQR